MTQEMQEISIDLIDAPQFSMRSDINDEGIDELADSIKKHGVLQPIIVRPAGNRFEIIAGHRRFIACRRIGKAKISAIVRMSDNREATILMVHENLLRRDVNPVDEAVFLAKVMREHNLDFKETASLLNRSESYIRERLDILDYPAYLIEAIGEKQVGLTAAHWLGKITDERVRQSYVDFAVRGGINTKRAIAWFKSWEAGQNFKDPREIIVQNPDTGQEEIKNLIECIICGVEDEVKNLGLHYAHNDCVRKIQP